MIDENRLEGTARNIGGKIQDIAGGLAGDAASQVAGKSKQAAGIAQDMYGQAADEIRTFTSAKPAAALFIAMGIGVVLGFLLRRR